VINKYGNFCIKIKFSEVSSRITNIDCFFFVKVKAMRFPPKSYNKDLESAEDRREREAQVRKEF
jgi:hypothetical protein